MSPRASAPEDVMLVDTRHLTGIALRYATATALGFSFEIHQPTYGLGHRLLIKGQSGYFRPDVEWAQMTFVEAAWREIVGWLIAEFGPNWHANVDGRRGDLQLWFCRGIIGARLGNEVSIPTYLLPDVSSAGHGHPR